MVSPTILRILQVRSENDMKRGDSIQVWFYYVSKDYLEERNGAALGFAVAAAESYGPSGLLHQKGC